MLGFMPDICDCIAAICSGVILCIAACAARISSGFMVDANESYGLTGLEVMPAAADQDGHCARIGALTLTRQAPVV